MRVFGFDVSVRRSTLSPVHDGRGWWPLTVREPFSGAWQRNIEWTADTVVAHHAVYACITLIASDIAKLRPKLVTQDSDGIWSETQSSAFTPVLKKPNRYQNRIQFIEWWITSKLLRGNAYVLKQRDGRGVVRGLYLLDPTKVTPLVAPDGSVFYQLGQDNLAGLEETNRTVPASEIIHDRMNCLFHPLVGISPIFAAGAAANVGIHIQTNSTSFFANDSAPVGILTAPGKIAQPDADEMSARWKAREKGTVAVLGNGLDFKPLRMSAEDSQLIEQLKWTAETVCSTFHVPPFKVGVGQMPTYSNGEILDQRYYSDCLQAHIESFELCMDEGLGLTDPKGAGDERRVLGVELDLDGLLRMDTATQVKTLSEGVQGAIFTPNEARRKMDLKPKTGGDTPYLQQQNYSLEALAKRDAKEDPFATNAPAPSEPEPDDDPTDDDEAEDVARSLDLRARTLRTKVAAA